LPVPSPLFKDAAKTPLILLLPHTELIFTMFVHLQGT
jgi:hypothetical protein